MDMKKHRLASFVG